MVSNGIITNEETIANDPALVSAFVEAFDHGLRDVINNAIRKVFARTIMTATTTFLAALALFLFGGGVLHDISFTFLVGIVTSTFSAIFIAAQVFYWWHKGDRKHVEAHADVAPKYEWQGTSKASE